MSLQYNSEDDKVPKEVPKAPKEVPKAPKASKEPVQVDTTPTLDVKQKKERTPKQIETTNKMRDALKLRRDANVKIKETAKLENDDLKKQIKKKIENDKVKKAVTKKIKEIIQSDTDDETTDESEDEIIIKKSKAKQHFPKKDVVPYPVEKSKFLVKFF